MVFMIEKLLALAPKSTNRQLHFFVPFNFGVYLFLSVLQILIKIQNTSTCIVSDGQIIIKNAVGTHVRIIDMSGRIVYGNRLSKAVETISVYPGVYIVKLGSSKTLKVAVK